MNPEKRKKMILAGAKRLFSRKGFYKTRISDIIKDVKIARGTIYQYFKTKDEIFITLLEDFYEKWEQSTSITFEEIELKTITPSEYFKYRIKKTLEFFANDRDLCNIILRMGQGLRGELSVVVKKFKTKIIHIFVNDLRFGVYNHLVRKDLNIELTATLITGALFFTAEYYFVEQSSLRRLIDIDRTADEIVGIFAPSIFKTKAIEKRDVNSDSAPVSPHV